MQQSSFDAAGAQFEEAVGWNAAWHRHIFISGCWTCRRKSTQKAISELDRAVRLDAQNPQTHYYLAKALLEGSKPEDCSRTASGDSIQPDFPDAQKELGLSLNMRATRASEAVEAFRKYALCSRRIRTRTIIWDWRCCRMGNGGKRSRNSNGAEVAARRHWLPRESGAAYLEGRLRCRHFGISDRHQGCAPLCHPLHYDLGLALKLKDKLPKDCGTAESDGTRSGIGGRALHLGCDAVATR